MESLKVQSFIGSVPRNSRRGKILGSDSLNRSESEMKTEKGPLQALIIYGSSRGTTTKIADSIAEGMKNAGASVSAITVDFVSLMPDRLRKADVLGIGSPVYFLREARYMTDFLGSLPELEGKKAFVFCNCGMDRVGETLHRMHAVLSARGAVVVGAQHFRSAMSYIPYRKRGFGNPDSLPDEKELSAARGFGERMTQALDLDAITLHPVSPAVRWKAQLLANKKFRRTFFPNARLNKPACTGYGSCLSRCLFGGLDRRDGEQIPYYASPCIQCLDCIAWCPRGAIVTDSPVKEWMSTLSYRLGLH